MRRWAAEWLDFRRGFVALAGSLVGVSVAAWTANDKVVSVALGFASIVLSVFVVKSYRAPKRLVLPDLSFDTPPEAATSNVHVVRNETR